MRLSVCTISFRHSLISLEELASFARAQGFQGIELWGPHARSLLCETKYDADWLSSFGLRVTMLSDYLPVQGSAFELREKTLALSELAGRWGTRKLRTFAGRVASARVSPDERARITERLRLACELLQPTDQALLVETHPDTLADTTASTLRLLADVDHPRLRVNFDVLHLWEAGEEPSSALSRLRNYVSHYHLKNVKDRVALHSFAPENVYSPAGSRAGMVPLFEGVFDYRKFLLGLVRDEQIEASLEWFGDDVKDTLRRDRALIHALSPGDAARFEAPDASVSGCASRLR
jgi:3-dehydroshikimate dehydratase